MHNNARRQAAITLLLAACIVVLPAGCDRRSASPAVLQVPSQPTPPANSSAQPVPAWLGKPLSSVRDASQPPLVLFDSFHAHNFLHRGLVPDEHSYHHFTGLRRAARLLEQRGCEVRELLVGPLTARELAGVQLLVVNLPSADRPPWLVSEIQAIEQYVRQGGGILFITDHSNCYYHQYHLLPLWDRLGLTPTFETACERQEDCKLAPTGAGWVLVRDIAEHPVTNGVRYFATQTGGRVAGEGVVAWTSDEAWADAGIAPLYGEGNMGLFGDMRYSDSEEQGKQGIILARGVGLGRVVVISDQNSLGDAFLSYGDNWRLWLSACKWCGQLNWDESCQSTTFNASASSQSSGKSVAAAGSENKTAAASIGNEPTNAAEDLETFRERIAGEADRNASPAMSPDAWSVHCWEPLESGRFYWGGSDAEQYYSFWCWMNRWFWVAANDQPHRPSEHALGRPMLLAVDREEDAAELVSLARQTLNRRGKVILLPASDRAAADQPSELETRRAIERAAKLLDIESNSLQPAHVRWSHEPVPHWRIHSGRDSGTLIIVAGSQPLRNSRFSRPEIAPLAATLKWENELRQWLFEQP